MRIRFNGWLASGGLLGLGFLTMIACGSGRDGFDPNNPDGGGGDGGPSGFGTDAGFGGDGAGPGLPEGETRDPITCDEARTSKSYVGCDYWPTVTPNVVWSIFDFAAVVANTGTTAATVTVTGPNGVNKTEQVPAGQLRKIYLPWVPALKGQDTTCLENVPLETSVVAPNGAYHLVSSVPVIVYQFNALQYKGEGEGAEGKNWGQCPASNQCAGQGVSCFSYSNDASLLLPSTAMTGNYRVIGYKGWTGFPIPLPVQSSVLTITATEPATEVKVSLSATASTVATTSGPSVPATNGGGLVTYTLANAGDVLQLATRLGANFDFSGSLVTANKSVQVITSVPCINIPSDKQACDHIEETVLPAETLGKHYVVHQPTGPAGSAVKHVVRFYGNRDNTTLTYVPSKPASCPATLNAGQVADCGLVGSSFEVSGDQEFAVAGFLAGAVEVNPGDSRGDPDETTFPAVEQFRTKYVFLAPNDYPDNYADISGTEDAQIELDGAPVTANWEAIGSAGLGVRRVKLGAGEGGAHVLTAKKPVGVQVVGYGENTSYEYPAGLNLKLIAPPPPGPK